MKTDFPNLYSTMHIHTEVYISYTHTCVDTYANIYIKNKRDMNLRERAKRDVWEGWEERDQWYNYTVK